MRRVASGFTLLETLLVVTSFSIILMIGIVVSLPFYQRNELEVTTTQIAYALRKANAFAISGLGDSTWGVRIDTTAATFFKGASYSGRDTTYDEVYAIPSWMVVGSATEIIFAKMTGFPTTAGSVTLNASSNGTRTITVNSRGLVTY